MFMGMEAADARSAASGPAQGFVLLKGSVSLSLGDSGSGFLPL